MAGKFKPPHPNVDIKAEIRDVVGKGAEFEAEAKAAEATPPKKWQRGRGNRAKCPPLPSDVAGEIARAERRATNYKMRAQGYTATEVCKILGVSRNQGYNDFKEATREANEARAEDMRALAEESLRLLMRKFMPEAIDGEKRTIDAGYLCLEVIKQHAKMFGYDAPKEGANVVAAPLQVEVKLLEETPQEATPKS